MKIRLLIRSAKISFIMSFLKYLWQRIFYEAKVQRLFYLQTVLQMNFIIARLRFVDM